MKNSIKSQQGATLVISLIMLLLFMVISISAVKSANVEERMASNSQYDIAIYHAAYSVLQQHVTNLKKNNKPFVEALSASNQKQKLVDKLTIEKVERDSELEYLSMGAPPPQFSLSKDYAGYRYKLQTKAKIKNIGALSTQTVGLMLAAPKS
ncbi:pilus assembly PilX family protein [Spartinivicinus poritis]|uniref:PilX N-terminal domain-containing pilus assembly protein n=1 Tax=Spartinivicinus poritis TaxID=2994640 RepID=A0ABT5UCU6_9GAMM|nr:PilX N-terminal domain-containing pilus assembly protein [Spartinivicinus sp. A2-2]MDE1464198.1 PilX N-terminal domain-containing pilus assembly protein [Spartinivicinus sp. A2-2]